MSFTTAFIFGILFSGSCIFAVFFNTKSWLPYRITFNVTCTFNILVRVPLNRVTWHSFMYQVFPYGDLKNLSFLFSVKCAKGHIVVMIHPQHMTDLFVFNSVACPKLELLNWFTYQNVVV